MTSLDEIGIAVISPIIVGIGITTALVTGVTVTLTNGKCFTADLTLFQKSDKKRTKNKHTCRRGE